MSKPVKIPEINPERFTWDNYDTEWAARLGIDYDKVIKADALHGVIRRRAIGYCDGSRLLVRPQEAMYGLMFEDENGDKFWFHYPKSCLDTILKGN